MKYKQTAIRLAGICGIFAPVVIFVSLGLALVQSPWFDWTNNALSDLGVRENVAALFNYGLFISGILSFIFSIGLTKILSKKIGAYTLAVSSLALACVGLFPETVFTLHYFTSATFFIFLALSLLILGLTIKQNQFEKNMGKIALVFSFFAFASPIFLLFFKGVAIPEAIAWFPALFWFMAYGTKMVFSG